MDNGAFGVNFIKTVQIPSNTEKATKEVFLQNIGQDTLPTGLKATYYSYTVDGTPYTAGAVRMYSTGDRGALVNIIGSGSNVQTFVKGKDPNKINFLADKASLEYTEVIFAEGMKYEPTVTVEGLTDADYTVSYENNAEVGTAKVVVKGAGNYYGTIELEFAIKAAPAAPGGEGETPEGDKDVPKTGDTAPIALMMGLMLVAAAGGYTAYRKNYTK